MSKKPRSGNTEPLVCINCKSEDIYPSNMSSDVMIAWRTVSCDECGAEWKETFTFQKWEEKL